ncbi:F0F1 ATP synthase subunit B [Tumebacillus sp. ITR2]|uniref:ATP synthase subunit b n=1 Tax=Tumebacillus amylolyticus TaxID=2801339 RepID=A0ABS1J585_9BACL|nr:F0F1 ATP synthase subunit B [Tumebacillus amylolyticus]MBL0385439.1 F0F1 ATP synthase subunit B [Tumebacillus amylolyticus]
MDFELGTALFQLVAFLILFLLLRKVAIGPLMRMMKERAQYIENQITTAEKNREEVERLAEENRAALQSAKKDAAEMLENARRSGEKQAADILAAAEEEARRIREEAVATINREKDAAIAELREQVGNLSVLLAGKIIAKELNAESHKALFEEAVKEMGVRV